MDDKIFELLEKLYSEVQHGFSKVNTRLDTLEKEVKQLGAKIDGDISPKVEVLLDGYKQNAEAINRIEAKLEDLSEKVDRHDIKIEVIEGGIRKAK